MIKELDFCLYYKDFFKSRSSRKRLFLTRSPIRGFIWHVKKSLRKGSVDDFAVDVGEAVVAVLEAVGEFFVIED